MWLSPNEVAHVVIWAGWTGPDREIAIAVAAGESGWETEAKARTHVTTSDAFGQWALGLFQISNYWHPDKVPLMGDWRDPYDNAQQAMRIFRLANGWGPWNAFTGGSYLRHMRDATIGLRAPVKAPRSPRGKANVT